ncbi:MAG: hypothetical protein ACLTSX_00810 [Collinsella sp.]
MSGISAVYALGGSAAVSWSPNHPDGSAQTKAEVEIVNPGGSTSTVPVPGSTAFAEVPLDAAGTWRLRVRTHGAHSDWGAWSGYLEFSVAALPVVTITDPHRLGRGRGGAFQRDVGGRGRHRGRISGAQAAVAGGVRSPRGRARSGRQVVRVPRGNVPAENLGRYTVEVSVRAAARRSAPPRATLLHGGLRLSQRAQRRASRTHRSSELTWR